MKQIFLFLCFLLLMAACSPSPELQASLTATEMTISTPAWTATATNKPATTDTQTPAPSSTLTSSKTPRQTGTATRMPILFSSPTANLAATVIALEQPRLYDSYPSPDGGWRANVLIYDCVKTFGGYESGGYENAYDQLRLINLITGEDKLADEQLQYCGGIGGYGLEGLFWSPNSRYFYYTTAREGIPEGDGSYWVPPLIRLDVTNLEKTWLGYGPRSPDGTRIAAIQWDRAEVVVWAFEGGEPVRFPAYSSDILIGPIVWSPDSQWLVYIQQETCCPATGKSQVILAELSGSEQTLLLESENPSFERVSWDNPYELRLFADYGKEWRYNLLTHELAQVP